MTVSQMTYPQLQHAEKIARAAQAFAAGSDWSKGDLTGYLARTYGGVHYHSGGGIMLAIFATPGPRSGVVIVSDEMTTFYAWPTGDAMDRWEAVAEDSGETAPDRSWDHEWGVAVID